MAKEKHTTSSYDLHQGVLSTGDSPRLMAAKMINHKIEEVDNLMMVVMMMMEAMMVVMLVMVVMMMILTMGRFQVMKIKMPAKTELMYGNTQRFQRQTSQVCSHFD